MQRTVGGRRRGEELGSAGHQVVQCLGSVAGDPFDEGAQEFALVAKAMGDRET